MLKIDELKVIEVIKTSKSVAEVNERIGYYRDSSAGFRRVRNIIKKYNVDVSHFTGQLWSKGKTILSDNRMHHKYNPEDIFCENSKVARAHVRRIIIQEKLIDYKCSECGIDEWRHKKISFDLEHKNGIRNDNRLENLTFLCPNCHSQTSTYKGRNNNKPVIPEQEILKVAETSSNIREILMKLGLSEGCTYKRIRRILQKNNFIFPHLRKENQIQLDEKIDRPIPRPDWRVLPKPDQRKVIRPSKQELIELVKTKSMLEITKIFGLKNDNSIRKWCECYDIKYKELSPFSHTYKKLYPKPIKIKKIIRKFTQQEIQDILNLIQEDNISLRKIAKKFSTCHQVIMRIRDKHLNGPLDQQQGVIPFRAETVSVEI